MQFSFEDQARVAQLVERVYKQRFRLMAVKSLISLDGPTR
jgi:hypothetical protein